MPIIWSRLARLDLTGLYSYLAAVSSPSFAIQHIQSIEAAANLLVDFPNSGLARDDLRLGVRSKIHRSTIIFYTVSGTHTVTVRRVLDQRQDYRRILKHR